MSTIMIQTTVADKSSAHQLAQKLFAKQLVACIHHIPIKSQYMWQDKLCIDNEILLSIKTPKKHKKAVKKLLQKHHPYEVPQIITLPIKVIHKPYAKWLQTVT